MFEESKHPRDELGRFTYSDGMGGKHIPSEAENRRLQELGIITEYNCKDRKAQANPEDKTTIKGQVKASRDKLDQTEVLVVVKEIEYLTGRNI